MKDEALINYRDYIKSPYWIERKHKYYETHEKKCAVCDHPDVDLHHITYGHYGSEPDSALVPLCRVHHDELHVVMGVRRNSRYQSRYFIEEAREKWQARFTGVSIYAIDEAPIQAPDTSDSGIADLLHKAAAPIWKLFDKLGL